MPLSRDGLLIAEIGNNHEGDAALAERLVRLAAESGAGAVKLQTFRAEGLVSERRDPDRFRRLRGFELRDADVRRLRGVARDAGLLFVSTPLDLPSAALLSELVDAFKIASGDLTFEPLLRLVASFPQPIILSSGLADLGLLRRALDVIGEVRGALRCDEVAILHCVSAYPAPPEEANLGAIPTLAAAFPHPVGYSDHTVGIEAAVVARALGARIIEKHFTIAHDHSDFRDHALSATPPELAELARRLRQVRAMVGDGVKRPRPCEEPLRTAIRRSICAAGRLAAGTVLEPRHLTWLRPGDGLAPGREAEILGRRLIRALEAGDPVTLEATAAACPLGVA
jgi:sialic acid synthase SpsE